MDKNNKDDSIKEFHDTNKVNSSFIVIAFFCVLIFSFVFLVAITKVPGYRHEGEGPQNASAVLLVIIAAVCYVLALAYYFAKSQNKRYQVVIPYTFFSFVIFLFDAMFAYMGATAMLFLLLGFPLLLFGLPIVTIVGVAIDKRYRNKKE